MDEIERKYNKAHTCGEKGDNDTKTDVFQQQYLEMG